MKRRTLSLILILCLALSTGAFASGEPSGDASDDLFAPVTFPEDATIVSATAYSVYTKSPSSMQDAVIKATLYWDMTNDEVYAIRFLQPMLPWDDNGISMGWACMTDKAPQEALAAADALVEVAEGVEYAKYLQIGGILWIGEVSSHPAAAVAVDYYADIDGETVALNDYVRTQEGAAWYVDAAMEPVYLLTSPEPAEGPLSDNVAAESQITYKENNGHGVYFWMSDILFPGNMEAIKQFVTENGFDYPYYGEGGITQNEEGFWQTPDAVSGATLEETPSYLDVLKTLYNEIRAGNYVVEHSAGDMPSGEASR